MQQSEMTANEINDLIGVINILHANLMSKAHVEELQGRLDFMAHVYAEHEKTSTPMMQKRGTDAAS